MTATIKWSKTPKQIADEMGIWVGDVTRLIALSVFKGVVEKTPVQEQGGGAARGSWLISLDDKAIQGEPGSEPKNNLPARMPRFPIIYVTNGLPYAVVLDQGLYPGVGPKTEEGSNPESGSGIFSSQAPQGMVALTMIEVDMRTQRGRI